MAIVEGNTTATGYGKTVPLWDDQYGTWRDPDTGLLAIGSDATGWRWVTPREFRGLPNDEPYAAVTNAAKDATNFANRTTGMTWDTVPVANKYGVAPEVFPDWGNVAPARATPAYPSVPDPFGTRGQTMPSIGARSSEPLSSGGLMSASRGYGVSKDIEDRRNLPPPIPAPAPAVPVTWPGQNGQIRIIGGQIVRF